MKSYERMTRATVRTCKKGDDEEFEDEEEGEKSWTIGGEKGGSGKLITPASLLEPTLREIRIKKIKTKTNRMG